MTRTGHDTHAQRLDGGQRPDSKRRAMSLFVIERQFADILDVAGLDHEGIKAVNDDVGIRWLYSFLSADKKKTYCLYEAPSAEAIREAARRLNITADTIIELGGQLRPEMFE